MLYCITPLAGVETTVKLPGNLLKATVVRSGQVRSGQVRSGQVTSGQVTGHRSQVRSRNVVSI